MGDEDCGRARDPRVERSRTAVLDATLFELAEVGYGDLTVEGVARRAQVSKATIYRHWDGKLDLVGDAIAELKGMPAVPDTDDHYERIVGFFEAVADHIANSQYSACIPALLEASLRDEALHEFHVRSSAARQAFAAGILDDAKAAGHLAPDVDTMLLAERLVAPILLRKLMAADPFPVDDVRRHVDDTLGPHWH